MLDIKFIRENSELIKSACIKKQIDPKIVDKLLKVDKKRSELIAVSYTHLKEYTNRLKAFNKQLTDNNVRVYFIGLPAMRDETYGNKIKHINELNQEAKKDNNQVIFISSEKLLEGYKACLLYTSRCV